MVSFNQVDNIILDRDGVINFDSPDYIKSPDEWQPIPGSIEAIVAAKQNGFNVFVLTNQSGVGRQLFSEDTLMSIFTKMQTMVMSQGGNIDGIVYCPHLPNEGCHCRKPQPGMFYDLLERFQIDLKRSVYIGDSLKDIQAALTANVQPILVRTGNGVKTVTCGQPEVNSAPCYDDLNAAITEIIKSKARNN